MGGGGLCASATFRTMQNLTDARLLDVNYTYCRHYELPDDSGPPHSLSPVGASVRGRQVGSLPKGMHFLTPVLLVVS